MPKQRQSEQLPPDGDLSIPDWFLALFTQCLAPEGTVAKAPNAPPARGRRNNGKPAGQAAAQPMSDSETSSQGN